MPSPADGFLTIGRIQKTHGRRGEVAVEINGEVHTAEAVSLEGDPIAAGTEVVIERIEGEVAFVEPWEVVERRI